MKFSKIICGTVLVVIGSLVLVSAGHYGGPQNGALMHYGGGRCHGHGCYDRHQAQTAHGAHGPYHSYAVRPAVYGGHGLYTYQGYARHQPAPPAHYRRARSYPARHYRGAARHYNAGPANNNYQNNHYEPHHLANYALKPVRAIALIHPAPVYHPQPYHHPHGGHYRAARGAYGHGNGNGNGNGHYQQQQHARYANGNGYKHANANGYGHGPVHHGAAYNRGGHHAGNGGY